MSFVEGLWGFFGWKWMLVLIWSYVCMLIGANSPQTFKRSKAGLERIANSAAAKAREIGQKHGL
jgi:hypothetical protein